MYNTYIGANPNLKIINVIGGSINGLDPAEDIEKAVNTFDESTPNVAYLIPMNSTTWSNLNNNDDYV